MKSYPQPLLCQHFVRESIKLHIKLNFCHLLVFTGARYNRDITVQITSHVSTSVFETFMVVPSIANDEQS